MLGKSNNVNNNNNNSNNTKILIVDDDFDTSNLIKMALQKQGYDVFIFTDPFLALVHFKINHKICNLVISDLRMPGMNGFEYPNLRGAAGIKKWTPLL